MEKKYYLLDQNGEKKMCFGEPLFFDTRDSAEKYVRNLPNVLETQFRDTFLHKDSVLGFTEELTIVAGPS